jgi:Ca2+/H+ antiporter
MSAVPSRFLMGGFASAALAAGVAYFTASHVSSTTSSLIAAALLAAGNVAGALWTASDRRRGQALDWVRLGLIAAALCFVALYVIVAPVLMQIPAAPQPTLSLYGVIAATVIVTALLIWLSLRLAWRRFAPKDSAP